MQTFPFPADAPIPPFTVPVTFRDGSLAGQTVEVDNETHHYLAPGEYYQRISEAPDGVLRSYFVLVREGYRAAKPKT